MIPIEMKKRNDFPVFVTSLIIPLESDKQALTINEAHILKFVAVSHIF